MVRNPQSGGFHAPLLPAGWACQSGNMSQGLRVSVTLQAATCR